MSRATDPAYLRYQYGDAEKLRVRQEAHERYSEDRTPLIDWLLPHIDPRPGLLLLDVGCGPGTFHTELAARGARIVGVDASPGMLREARALSRADKLAVRLVRADAERLPVRDAWFDRVTAHHMLYHVPDQLAALREMRRALKPGGRVVLTTNIASAGRRLAEVHEAAARGLGYSAPGRIDSRFNLDTLPLVESVFPGARRYLREDAFLFPDVDSALRYYASGLVDAIEPLPGDGSHRGRLLPLVAAGIGEIIAREGVFRVPKGAGCFVAEL